MSAPGDGARDTAVETLLHYFAIAMGHKSAAGLPPDCQIEIAAIVDAIITAAVLRAESTRPAAQAAADAEPEPAEEV